MTIVLFLLHANIQRYFYFLLTKGNLTLFFHKEVNSIGLLQQTITFFKIRHAGGQAHYYSRTGTLKQRNLNQSNDETEN